MPTERLLKFIFLAIFILIAIIFLIIFLNGDNSFETILMKNNNSENVQAIVSSQELATEAGFEILQKGGTSADAAVAVASVLSVVEPWFSSALGGGTWALYYDAETEEVVSLDGVGPVGSLATVEDYSARANSAGIHQSIVPGSWDAWMILLEKYGKLDLKEILSPAIRIAEQGYPVSSDMKSWLDRLSEDILNRPNTSSIYAPRGVLLNVGETVYQQDMAKTFQELVLAYENKKEEGRASAIQSARDYYYRGPIAEDIVNFSDIFEGYLTIEDFYNFETNIVDPISIKYNDQTTVFENPPNSQGIVMLLALNILKENDFSELDADDPNVIHQQVEALKLSFADRYYYIGDPERINIPIEQLLSDKYAENQRSRINMEKAMSWPIDAGSINSNQSAKADHTTTFHIIDKKGNAIAVTTSLGAEFLVTGDTGIHINNRMRMIALDDGNPNQLTPGYKVRHTSNPYMALQNGKPYILGGNTGVDTQPQGQLQQFMSVVEFGMSAQEAIDRHRFVSTSFPAGTYPYNVRNILQMESGFPGSVIEELRFRGHNIIIGGGVFGSANMIVVDESGQFAEAGAESRENASGRVILP
jgi:gamma-glutamyltranspeptidase/glutathione hydrolase